MSYDVGVEKPDTLMFEAAELMLAQAITIQEGKSPTEVKVDIETWRRVYVGDEYKKDIVGATNTGWNFVLLDSGEQSPDIPRLDGVFKENAVVRVQSTQSLTAWLTGGGWRCCKITRFGRSTDVNNNAEKVASISRNKVDPRLRQDD